MLLVLTLVGSLELYDTFAIISPRNCELLPARDTLSQFYMVVVVYH